MALDEREIRQTLLVEWEWRFQSGLHFHLSPAPIPTMLFSYIVIDYQ